METLAVLWSWFSEQQFTPAGHSSAQVWRWEERPMMETVLRSLASDQSHGIRWNFPGRVYRLRREHVWETTSFPDLHFQFHFFMPSSFYFFFKLNLLLFSSLLKEMVSDFHDTTYVPLLIPTCAQKWFLRHTLPLAFLLLPLSWNFPLRLTFLLFSASLSLQARSWQPGLCLSLLHLSHTAWQLQCLPTHWLLLLLFVYCYSPLEE